VIERDKLSCGKREIWLFGWEGYNRDKADGDEWGEEGEKKRENHGEKKNFFGGIVSEREDWDAREGAQRGGAKPQVSTPGGF